MENKLADALSDFMLQADNEMGVEEMAKVIAKSIKKAARSNDISDRRYFYSWIAYHLSNE
jgi:hypothetical protein